MELRVFDAWSLIHFLYGTTVLTLTAFLHWLNVSSPMVVGAAVTYFSHVLYEIKDLLKNNRDLEKHFPAWISDALLAKYHGTFRDSSYNSHSDQFCCTAGMAVGLTIYANVKLRALTAFIPLVLYIGTFAALAISDAFIYDDVLVSATYTDLVVFVVLWTVVGVIGTKILYNNQSALARQK